MSVPLYAIADDDIGELVGDLAVGGFAGLAAGEIGAPGLLEALLFLLLRGEVLGLWGLLGWGVLLVDGAWTAEGGREVSEGDFAFVAAGGHVGEKSGGSGMCM